jgi:D-methionine transport system substrate-binding protein
MHKLLLLLVLLITGCNSDHKGLRVAATPVPHAEILEFIKPDLAAQGIDLQILVMDDYNIPNRALSDGEVDANFFQHRPFLEMQIEAFHYPIEELTPVEIEPMGLYSQKIKSLSGLKEGSVVAIPNDPSNEARALFLLQSEGLIELSPKDNPLSTLHNITSNPKKLKLIEVDAAMIPRALQDVALAAINTNFALEAGLIPTRDALALESKNSPYANILVIRKGDADRADIQALKTALTSDKMREFLLEKYKQAILPAW